MKTPMIALAALAAAATVMSAAPAAAENVGIEWRDLNLETVEGQRALDRRIDNAAQKVCGLNEIRTGSRFVSRDAQRCFDQARAAAEVQVASIREETRLGG